MRIVTLSSPLSADRSFRIALGCVAIFAAAEIFATGYYYVARTRAASVPVAPKVAIVKSVVTPPPPPPAITTPPPLSLTEQVLVDAVALRDRGDTANALARLQEASEKDPSNAKILEELAKTYEAVQNIDLANETWRKIQQLGPSAGTSFALADQRLKTGLTTPEASGAGLPGPARLDVASASAAGQPSSEGSTFDISELNVTEAPDADADTNLMLRVGIQKRTKAVIDHTKVKIQVFFYDTVDDKDIKLTDADVTYEWLTPNHDWADTSPEVLSVNYVRPKNKVLPSEAALSAAAASVNPGKKTRANKPGNPDNGQRKYLGYIVRVYYKDQLQAVRAEPTRLLNLFPPPFTAPPQ